MIALTKLVFSIFDAVDALVVVLDREGKIVYFNQVSEQITNYSIEQVAGSYLWDLFLTPQEVQPFIARFEELKSGLFPNRHENYWVTKNGNQRLISCSYKTLVDGTGLFEYIVCTGIDITEQRQVEEELKASLNNYSAFDAANDIIFVHDLRTLEFIYANQKACDMFGYTHEELALLNINDLSLGEPPYTMQEASKQIQKAATTGEPQIFEWVGKHRTGRLFWTEINLKPTPIAGRDCLLVIERDITERKQAEEALRKQAFELQQALQELKQTQVQLIQSEKMSSLGQLVAGVAHEINNPVNFIYGNISHITEYIQDLLGMVELYTRHYTEPILAIQQEIEKIDWDFIREDLPKMLISIQAGADRIREIVISLRNFSRLDEAEMKLVNIHEGIDSTLLILQSRLKATKFRPEIEIIKNYSDLPLVECYPGQLNQVFMNIIANAIDALDNPRGEQLSLEESWPTPDQIQRNLSQITIHTEILHPNYVTVRIADNGSGMTEDTQKKLFDPFFTTKSVGKGTGLGLSISYQIIVNKHHGKLQCVSAPGEGAEFAIEIPVRQAQD